MWLNLPWLVWCRVWRKCTPSSGGLSVCISFLLLLGQITIHLVAAAAAAAAAAAVSLQSCPTLQLHRWQPTRLRCPWDSPGKNTGVGCHFLLQCMKSESEVAQSCRHHLSAIQHFADDESRGSGQKWLLQGHSGQQHQRCHMTVKGSSEGTKGTGSA